MKAPSPLPDITQQAARKRQVMAELARYPFRPPWWLRNNHLQTLWANRARRVKPPPLRLETIDAPDGDFLRLHFNEGDPEKPLVLLLHGLEGSVQSRYILGVYHEFIPIEWNIVTLEHRSCGGKMNRALRLYHSGATEDLDFVVDHLCERFPTRPIYIAGFSLGGNVTAKWLGQKGASVPENVKGAAVISAPYDLAASAAEMDKISKRIYVSNFLRSLIPKVLEKEKQFPGCVDVEAVKRCKTFREYDTVATAALHGFKDAHDYYAKVACGQFLEGIRRPVLLLSGVDDPFNPGYTLPYALAEESPYLHPQFTPRGGHVGHAYGWAPGRLAYWAEEQIRRFFVAYDRLQ